MKSILLSLAASAAVLVAASSAAAATIIDNFTFTASGDPGAKATGSFSYNSTNYDATHSGLLTYSDLESFHVTLFGQTFNLPFVDTLISSPTSSQDYIYFGFNAKANTFEPDLISGANGASEGILAALGAGASTPNTGFFFDPLTKQGGDGLFELFQNGSTQNYLQPATFSITSRVPEPSTWAMMIIGLAGVGAAARGRRRKSGSAWVASKA